MNEEERIKLRERLVTDILRSRTMPPDEAVKAADKIYRWIVQNPTLKDTE